MHFRMFMSRLHIAKQELESKVLDHERQVASAMHLAACEQMCQGVSFRETQCGKISTVIVEAKWHGSDGIKLATALQTRVREQCRRDAEPDETWKYATEGEWERMLNGNVGNLAVCCRTGSDVYNKVIELGGQKIQEYSWKLITMGLLFLGAGVREPLVAMSPHENTPKQRTPKVHSRSRGGGTGANVTRHCSHTICQKAQGDCRCTCRNCTNQCLPGRTLCSHAST
jgi:hypothetical protein